MTSSRYRSLFAAASVAIATAFGAHSAYAASRSIEVIIDSDAVKTGLGPEGMKHGTLAADILDQTIGIPVPTDGFIRIDDPEGRSLATEGPSGRVDFNEPGMESSVKANKVRKARPGGPGGVQ